MKDNQKEIWKATSIALLAIISMIVMAIIAIWIILNLNPAYNVRIGNALEDNYSTSTLR